MIDLGKATVLKKLKEELEGEVEENISSPEGEQYYLEFSNGAEKGKLILLNQKVSFGRDAGQALKHPSVSNNHCTFFFDQGVVSVVDNGSTNGTLVAGKKIKPGQMIILEAEDAVSIGQVEFKLVLKHPHKIKDSQLFKGMGQGVGERTSVNKINSFFGRKKTKLQLAASSDEASSGGLLARLKSKLFAPKEMTLVKEQAPSKGLWGKLMSIFKRHKKVEESVEEMEEEVVAAAPPPKTMKLTAVKETPKKKNTFKNQYVNAGSLIRLMAVMGDVVLVLLLTSWMESWEEGRAFFETMKALGPKFLAPYLGRWDLMDFAEDIYALIPPVATYMAMSLIGVIFFGVGPSQFILGIRARGASVWWPRLGGVLRTLLGFVTGPFLIFDLTSLFGLRTIKEYLTFTGLVYERNAVKVIMAILYTVVILPVFFFYPLLKNLDLIQGLEVHVTGLKKYVPKVGAFTTAPSNTLKMQSHLFRLQAKYKPSGRFQLIPRFEINKKGKELNYEPTMIIYDLERDMKGEMRVMKQFSLRETLIKAKRLNPIFGVKYPKINEELDAAVTSWQQGVDLPAADEASVLNYQHGPQKEIKGELEDLVLKSIDLALADLLEKDQQMIPLVKVLSVIREDILREVGLPELPYVEKIKLGNLEFLRFTLEKNSKYLVGQAFFKEVYLPLGVKSGVLYEMTWDRVKQYDQSVYQFLGEFFADASWVIDLKQPFPLPSAAAPNFNAFSILDFFVSSKMKGDDRDALEEYIYQYFFQLSALSLTENKERFRLFVQGTLKRYSSIMEMALSGKNRPKRKAFQDRMNDLYINLRELNRAHFKLDMKTK